MNVSISNTSLFYMSIYDGHSGERVTSFVTGVHGDTVEELREKAESEYPDKVHVEQTAEEYINAMENDLLYKGGKYVKRPEPTEEEKKKETLAKLDVEYASKIGSVEEQMAKAIAVEDEEYYEDLKEEREELVVEYEKKRGEI